MRTHNKEITSTEHESSPCIAGKKKYIWIGRDSDRGEMQYQIMSAPPLKVSAIKNGSSVNFIFPDRDPDGNKPMVIHVDNDFAELVLPGRSLSVGSVVRIEFRIVADNCR